MNIKMMLWGMWSVCIFLSLSLGASAFLHVYKCVNDSYLQVSLDLP